jgi:NTP pyrophosphatase (non-canonical NTP hydrolase)
MSDKVSKKHEVLFEVSKELDKAILKFPSWPTDPLHALSVLGEEFGELTKEVLQLTYEPHKSTRLSVRKEAMHTAAMAIRFLMSLDNYEYRSGRQH